VYILERAGICTYMYICVSYVEVMGGVYTEQHGMLSFRQTLARLKLYYLEAESESEGKNGDVAYDHRCGIMQSARLQPHQ
jgi:hypothetical protein